MSMWAVIGIMVVVFIVGYLISRFTDAVMTDNQKKDDTPVFYRDENGVMQQTTQADQTRQMIGKGCLWVIGAIIALVCWILSLGGC